MSDDSNSTSQEGKETDIKKAITDIKKAIMIKFAKALDSLHELHIEVAFLSSIINLPSANLFHKQEKLLNDYFEVVGITKTMIHMELRDYEKTKDFDHMERMLHFISLSKIRDDK